MLKKRVVLKIVLSAVLLSTGLMAGCSGDEETARVTPDPFTSTWNLGEEGKIIILSGNTAGHKAGELSEFVLTLDNTGDKNTWSGSYCMMLLDREGIVMEIASDDFSVSSGLAPHTTIPVTFDDNLRGPYGLSLVIPNRLQQVTTIWVGTERQGDAGPWPLIISCSSDTSEEAASALAEEYILRSPTYLFDGINGSLEFIKAEALVTHSNDGFEKPHQLEGWNVTIRFENSQAGYGDRSDQMLAQVITSHEAVITVENGIITAAVLDGKWNMLEQRILDE